MGIFIKSVSRTEIVLNGMLPAKGAAALFDRIRGEELVSMLYAYDGGSDTTTLSFFPCRTETIKCSSPTKEKEGYDDYRILMLGKVPSSVNLIEDIWVPHRKKAKRRDGDDMKHVMCYNPRLIRLEGTEKVVTEIGFIADFRCADRDEAIKRAAMLVSQDLRTLADAANPAEMVSAKLLDYISARMAAAIEDFANPDGQAFFDDDLMVNEYSEPSNR